MNTLPAPLSENEPIPGSLDFPIVGIAAGEGGPAAMLAFFRAMPADCGMAFIVVQSAVPGIEGLADLLGQATPMLVCAVGEPQTLEPGHVYLAPLEKPLRLHGNEISADDGGGGAGTRPIGIDLFLRLLAVVHRDRAIAVVLSGQGADGAVGITRIKEEGGLALAQSPAEAECAGMPRAAIASGTVDWVLPVAQLPRKLLDIWANARDMELPVVADAGLHVRRPGTAEGVETAEAALRDVLLTLRARTGHDFRNYKRATVLRRLERRMQVHGLRTLPAYRDFLQAQPEEASALLKDLLIGVTNFFRDPEAYEVLQREVIPGLIEHAAGSTAGVRVWVAGCATGEEAYSIAMLLCEQLGGIPVPPKVHIFGTDLDESAIGTARLGVYPAAIETDLAPSRLRRFFDKDGSQYRIRKEVREKVMFAEHNILHDPPFSKLDLICCRNLLIYLDRSVHAEVLEMFHFALKPGGYLFLGSSESADSASALFSVVDKKNRIFRATSVARSPRYMPGMPSGAVSALPVLRGMAPAADKRRVTFSELHRRLAEQHAPPSVLIDGDGNIVHLSEQAGRFLRHSGGEPSHQLLSLVHPALRLELRTAIFQAAESGKSVEARRVRMSADGSDRYVTMIVRPVHEPEVGNPLALVLFDDVEDSMASDARAPDAEGRDPMVAQLEEELRRVREQLQGTIEHSETSTEELKASNEELQAMNEELRSTTEELETSKEELQSINEELITVNHELKSKVEETGKINDDLQNLIASTDIATVFVDRAMSIKRYTPHATRLFNLIPSDVGRSLLDITHRLDYEALADDAAEAFQSLRMIEREVSSHDGHWYLARVLPYRTTEDRIDGAVLTFVDITGRHRAEEAVRLMAESTKDFAIVTWDTAGRITTWNPGAERLFGYTEAEAIGEAVEMIYTPEDRAAGVPDDETRRARETGRAEEERWHQRKDGTRFYCSGVVTPLVDEAGVRGYGKIARDLNRGHGRAATGRKSAGRADELAGGEFKAEFVAALSHALKNPLNLIQLNTELLARTPDASAVPAVVRSIDVIRRAIASQAQIIDDLLDLSRLNTAEVALQRGPLDFAAVTRRVADALSQDARDRQVDWSVHLPAAPAMLEADAARIEQVVWNLLGHALKSTPRGGRVDTVLRLLDDRAELSVCDGGPPPEPEALAQAFELLRVPESSAARRQGDLGVGLALVRALVHAHGGLVQAQAAEGGRGTCYTIALPLAGHSLPTAEGVARQAARLQGRRALLLDEDPASQQTLRELLTLEGAVVHTAGTAEEALAIAAREALDFALVDVPLREMDSAHFLGQLRSCPGLQAMPVIALATLGRAVDAKRAIAAGFTAHVKKPITLEQLLQVLGDALS